MSAIGGKADIALMHCEVRFCPIADIARCPKKHTQMVINRGKKNRAGILLWVFGADAVGTTS